MTRNTIAIGCIVKCSMSTGLVMAIEGDKCLILWDSLYPGEPSVEETWCNISDMEVV